MQEFQVVFCFLLAAFQDRIQRPEPILILGLPLLLGSFEPLHGRGSLLLAGPVEREDLGIELAGEFADRGTVGVIECREFGLAGGADGLASAVHLAFGLLGRSLKHCREFGLGHRPQPDGLGEPHECRPFAIEETRHGVSLR